MASTFATSGQLGVSFSRRTATPEFALGQVVVGDQNTAWIYVLASGAVATGTCTVDTSTYAVTDTAGDFTADTAFASGEYGWVRQTDPFLPDNIGAS